MDISNSKDPTPSRLPILTPSVSASSKQQTNQASNVLTPNLSSTNQAASVQTDIGSGTTTTPRNIKNLSIKEFFASRLMRAKSFEGGGHSPKDETTNWFDEFKARMTKKPQKPSSIPSPSYATLEENQSEESNDSGENLLPSLPNKIKSRTKSKNPPSSKRSKQDLQTSSTEKNNCDNTNYSLLTESFEEISEDEAGADILMSPSDSTVSFKLPNKILRERKLHKISCVDKPDFDTASINTILDRRDSRYEKLRRKRLAPTFSSHLAKLIAVVKWVFINFLPLNHTLPWKLISTLNFAFVIMVVGLTANTNPEMKVMNFVNGFICGLSAAIVCMIIIILSIFVRMLPDSRNTPVVSNINKNPTVGTRDHRKSSTGFGHESTVSSSPKTANESARTFVSTILSSTLQASEDYSETEIFDCEPSNLDDENYRGWMLEFIGDYELRHKLEIKPKLLHVRFENRVLHLYKVKSDRDIESSTFPSNVPRRTYDLKAVKKLSVNLLFPKNVRNLKKWLWSKKYPIRLEFNQPEGTHSTPNDDTTPSDGRTIQLTLFTKTCREKEEWFRRFKRIVEETRLAQVTVNKSKFSPSSESHSTDSESNTTKKLSSSNRSSKRQSLNPFAGRDLSGVQTSQSSHLIGDSKTGIEMEELYNGKSLGSQNLVRTKSFDLIPGSSSAGESHTYRDKDADSLERQNLEESTLTQENALLFSQAVDDLNFIESRPNLNYIEYITRVIESTKGATSTSDWFNSLTGRIFFDVFSHNYWSVWFKRKIQRKLYRIRLPYFMETLTLTNIDLGSNAPQFLNVVSHQFDALGLSIDFDVAYGGGLTMTFETKLNLLKIKPDSQPNAETASSTCQANGQASSSYVPSSPPSDGTPKDHGSLSDSSSENLSRENSNQCGISNSENQSANSFTGIKMSEESTTTSESSDSDLESSSESSYGDIDADEISDWEDYGAERTRQNIVKFVDKLASSRYFQQAAEYRYIKKKLQDISNCPLVLVVQIQSLNGILTLNVPPPQTDRIWYGFRPNPEIALKAVPKMGEREVNFVTEWIERKLEQEFRKILVLPNMEDIVLPVLKSDHLLYVTPTK